MNKNIKCKYFYNIHNCKNNLLCLILLTYPICIPHSILLSLPAFLLLPRDVQEAERKKKEVLKL